MSRGESHADPRAGRRTVGIDLGTSRSAVAVIGADGEPVIVPIPAGGSWVPSVVTLAGSGDEPEILVGARAHRAAAARPEDTVTAFKRLIGRRFDDDEVQRLARALPYQVIAAPNGDAWAQARGVALSPPWLSALVLRELVGAAEAWLGEPVRDAVITVPARFDIEQRRATRDAAEIAGLQVRRLINEPTAAALGVGAHRGADQRLAVCDLGAGTFDVSIVNVEEGVIEVLASAGDSFLGGEDVDRILADCLVDEIRQQHGLDVTSDPPSLQRLLDECRTAKHRLSQQARAEIALVLAVGSSAPLEYRRTVRRDELEFWIESTLDLLEPPCMEAAARCGLRPGDVDSLILVGGSARIPAVQHKLAGVFGRAPRVIGQREVVALGAARLAAMLDGDHEEVAVLDVTARAIGVDLGDGKYQQVIARNTAVPTREHKVVATIRADQRELELDVYEGESPAIADNRLLGRFVCSGLSDGPAGHVMVAFDFTVDVDGLLRVSASEMGGGGNSHPELRLRATAGLTRAHVERMRAALAGG
ncbi:MAG TPA: Hsp70 family protein [Kofleriaceae bacterium]|nr:Hsp70 family protein [Kofleriaceae bacterium]